jgi:hypothetical protein
LREDATTGEEVLMETHGRGLARRLGVGFGLWLAILLAPGAAVRADQTVAKAISIETSCEVDLNGDKVTDLAFSAQTSRGWEVIVMLRKPGNYQVFMLSDSKARVDLVCRLGATITELKNQEAAPKTTGSYLLFQKLGKPTVAYYWGRGTFQEVWIEE